MNVLGELQQWYKNQCDGYWEHQYGIRIDTLDNPGWKVLIDLNGTNLEGKPFQEVFDLEPEHKWIRCSIEDGQFVGVGGSEMLEKIIKIFLEWAKTAA